ncbi:MAG: maltodextrin glucosidase [Ardenticatenaceae bacterium]|nr:hypothetical protein [Anaerolineales bacterium]MCB8922709.1 maltodextrin glucosidase [Ardenticatenaceae bacterium]MCB9003583.1 maltodextrin glucosidase [Ardenticatenaceae bacterium]
MIIQPSLPNWLGSVHHDGSALYVSDLYPKLGDTVQVRLRVAADAPVTAVYLRTFPDGEQALTPMQREESALPVQWWTAVLPITQPTVHYRFLLRAKDGVWWHTADGSCAGVPLDKFDFRLLADYEPVRWLETAVFYQIFPDRFHNGDPAADPQPDEFEFRGNRPQTYPWGQPPPEDALHPIVFYGGDLPGITQKLDYLQQLGVNALYLNPIFTAHSNHKYDVADYDHVDPHFGGDEALIALREALSARKMRYLLDVVPNHCGYWHPWFQNARENPDAPEAEFFTFNQHPDDYASWLGVWMLPKLNYRSAELRRRIYAGEDAVFRRWLRPPFAADGWRVDVANMLGRQGATQMGVEVTQGIRRAVKETRADGYLLGENFFDATDVLQDGDQWDGVMNYASFGTPLLYWLSGYRQGAHGLHELIETAVPWPTFALLETWQRYLAAIPWGVALQQYNLLGSHDTPRIRTLVGENDALHRLAVVVLMTYPGVPALFYGDEIGLVDQPGVNSRVCMPWDEADWNQDLLAFYREMVHLRRETAVLQTGGFQLLLAEADTFAYQRESVDERAIVIAHRTAAPRPAGHMPVADAGIADGTRFVEFFSGQEAIVQHGALPLPPLPQGATLWLQTPEARGGDWFEK